MTYVSRSPIGSRCTIVHRCSPEMETGKIPYYNFIHSHTNLNNCYGQFDVHALLLSRKGLIVCKVNNVKHVKNFHNE